MTIKALVTSGCSFSNCSNYDQFQVEENKTWPIWLREKLLIPHFSEAMAGQGNGLISRKTLHRLNALLKTYKPEEIFVGVMWTGRDRFDFFFEDPIELPTNNDGWLENPTKIVSNAPGGWVILNPHWSHRYNAPWFKNYYNETAGQVYTLEHIVHLQNFLKLKGINYFFTSSFSSHINHSAASADPNCSWLYEQIDWSNWLPIESQRHWITDNCEIPGANNFHPRNEQHEKFVDQVIVPWLKQRNILTAS